MLRKYRSWRYPETEELARDDEYEFVHTVDKCLIKKSDSSEKISKEQSKKDRHGNVQTENKIVHKKKASLR